MSGISVPNICESFFIEPGDPPGIFAHPERSGHMDAAQRREEIRKILGRSREPVSAATIASEVHVSRQIVVGDIALLRAGGADIQATPRGYILQTQDEKAADGLTYTIACRHSRENLAEELRVLYVAMTRPKEKLIMTGMASKLESRVKQCAAHAGRQEELLSYQTLSSASGYLDWILPAFSRNRCFDGLYEQFGLAGNADNPLYAEKIPVTIRLVSPAGLVEGEVLHQMERAVNEQKIMEIPKQPPREAALKELVEERFAYQYPYEKEKQIPVKVTVSQLKKAGMEESEIGKELFAQEELVPIVPGFLKKDHVAALTGSDRGTAYHRLLECLDYRRAYSITELMAQTEELIAEGKMTKEAAECIYFKSILAFAKSPVGMRMRNAFLNETLKREQPFVMSVPASEADPSYPEDETILVQGIIDAWFPEGDEIVLVDYKTDRVKEAGELKKRYEKQLAYYQQALERTTGKKVKEKIIYSLALDEELVL